MTPNALQGLRNSDFLLVEQLRNEWDYFDPYLGIPTNALIVGAFAVAFFLMIRIRSLGRRILITFGFLVPVLVYGTQSEVVLTEDGQEICQRLGSAIAEGRITRMPRTDVNQFMKACGKVEAMQAINAARAFETFD